MLVILRENVENLGRTGEVVNVTAGYARNFLLPRNLVVAADAHNVEMIEHHKKALQKKRDAQKAAAQEIAKKLGDFTVKISRKVGEHDKIFGSVSNTDIAEVLKKNGFAVEKRWIHIEHPIKAIGSHSVVVKLEPEVSATVKVMVAKEE